MSSFFRYKKNDLLYSFITIHENLAKDIFNYFENGRLIRKKSRRAHKIIKSALKYCIKKQIYPEQKIVEAKNELLSIDKELQYMHRAAQAVYNETDKIITMIRKEKTEDILSTINIARENFKENNITNGTFSLREVETKLKNNFLPKSRDVIFGGLDSEIKSLKSELLKRRMNQLLTIR